MLDVGAGDGYEEVHDDTESATFYLYRVESGQQVTMGQEGGYYLGFTMTKDGAVFFDDPGSVTDEEFANIKITETGEGNPWHVNITGLPEFDEGGRQYDYVLVEANASPPVRDRARVGRVLHRSVQPPGAGGGPADSGAEKLD